VSRTPSPESGPSDAELVAACRQGQTEAFGTLVERHQDRAYGLAYRLTGNGDDAAEAVQEAFLNAWRALDRFRAEAGFYTWFYRIVVNVVRSRQRFKAVRPREHSYDIPGAGRDADGPTLVAAMKADGPDPSEEAGRKEREVLLQQALTKLEPEQRTLILLRDIEGHDYGMIAEMLECPRGTVKSRLHRARKALKNLLAPILAPDQEAAT
jgi:RNA polymerase sigma-70 factor, ECF subfamily